MPTRLDWRVGPAGDESVPTPTGPTIVRRRRSRWTATLFLVTLYGGALLVAAAFGFQLGRWQEARDADLGGIRNQLAVEDLAWLQGDQSLYASTLDPDAVGSAEAMDTFLRRAPATARHELLSVTRVPPDRAVVRVRSVPPPAASAAGAVVVEEDRHYRLVGRSWLRTDAR